MKISLVSDLHLEVADLIIKNDEGADVLVLAGDILVAQYLHDHPAANFSNAEKKNLGPNQSTALRFRDFIARAAFQFPHVVAVAGNHEFYHGMWYRTIDTLRNEYGAHPNIHFLEDDTVKIDDVTFVGGTMWTDMNKNDPLTEHATKDLMNDFKVIRDDRRGYSKLHPVQTTVRHRNTVQYIKEIVHREPEGKFVMVTHHAPSFASVNPQYVNQTLMNGAYASDLSELILDHPQIKLATHGHMHDSCDYVIGETRIVCNPRGYCGYERGSQDSDPYFPKIIEV